MWSAIKDGRKEHQRLAEKVNNVEVLVAGQYVTRDEFNQTMKSVDAKLDRIADKVGAVH